MCGTTSKGLDLAEKHYSVILTKLMQDLKGPCQAQTEVKALKHEGTKIGGPANRRDSVGGVFSSRREKI